MPALFCFLSSRIGVENLDSILVKKELAWQEQANRQALLIFMNTKTLASAFDVKKREGSLQCTALLCFLFYVAKDHRWFYSKL